MATRVVPQSVTFRDAKGYPWTMRTWISFSDADAAHRDAAYTTGDLIVSALIGAGPGTLPLTNGILQSASGPFGWSVNKAYGTAAQSLNAEDKLMVALLDTAGVIHRFGIGSPVIAAFLADQETGKGSQLVDFIAAMTTISTGSFACTKEGIPFTGAVTSLLVRRRQRRKVSLLSKSSNLDEPGE